MTKRKQVKKASTKTNDTNEQEYLVLGHLIKYNLYLLTKAVVFSAISKNETNPYRAAELTNNVIQELDLDTKRRLDKQTENSAVQ